MIAGLYKIFDHWHQNGTVWLVSDTHFNDEELYAGTKHINRSNSEAYVKLINSKVGKNDTLIHLGDVGNLDAMRKVRGYKILIMGNHDAGRTNYERKIYTKRFNAEKYDRKTILAEMRAEYPDCRISISGPFVETNYITELYFEATADNCLFDEIYEGPVMVAEKLILSHEPVNIPWAFNIHGHKHDPHYQNDDHHFNICPEGSGSFEPVNFNQFMKSGFMSRIQTIHRDTIDRATKRSRKRKGKK